MPVADGAIDKLDGFEGNDYCRVPFVNVEADITISCETMTRTDKRTENAANPHELLLPGPGSSSSCGFVASGRSPATGGDTSEEPRRSPAPQPEF